MPEAKKAGADLALFPEMWSSGYDIPESVEELEHKAVAADGPFVKAFANAARELSMAIGITILEQYPEGQGTRCFYWTVMGNVCCPMRRSIPVISGMSAA